MSPAEHLARLAERLRLGERLAPEEAELVAAGLELVAIGERDAAEAFGLRPSSSALAISYARRAELISDLAAHFPGSPSAKAKAIATAAQRFALLRWPRLRLLGEAPPALSEVDQLLLGLHRNAEGGARWPLSWRAVFSRLQQRFGVANFSGHGPIIDESEDRE